MKISGRKNQPISPFGPAAQPAASEESARTEAPSRQTDQVDISRSSQIRDLAAAARAMPAVRTERVDELRDSIDQGQYHVESEKLARKVVDDVLNDLMAQKAASGA